MVSESYSAILAAVPKKKSPENEQSFSIALHEFFLSELGQKAASGLADGACVLLVIDDKEYFFRRSKGKNMIASEANEAPDVKFWTTQSTMRHLFAQVKLPATTLGTLGIAIFEGIFEPDPTKKIRFRVEASIFSLWGKGYFSVLKAGGPEVASYLARWGFDSFSKIKEVLQKIRG